MPNRPDRMWRLGRPAVPDFEPSELLYHRCEKRHLISVIDGELFSIAVRLPDFSVNRQQYSEPEDVLIAPEGHAIENIEKMGIVQFPVSSIPASLTPPQGGKTTEFKVEHSPDEDNYAHSEVRAYQAGKKVASSKEIAETVKKDFRSEIARHSFVYKPPEV